MQRKRLWVWLKQRFLTSLNGVLAGNGWSMRPSRQFFQYTAKPDIRLGLGGFNQDGLLDLAERGTVERILSFMVVGILLLVGEYLSPVPTGQEHFVQSRKKPTLKQG